MYQKIITTIQNAPPLVKVVDWSKKTSFSGFQGVSVNSVVRFLNAEVLRNSLMMTRANSIAFSFFMSLFPAFLVLFSLIPYVIGVLPIEKKQILDLIHEAISEIMPNDTGEMFYKEISKFIKTKRSDFLSIGFILSIYFSSNGLMALMSSFEKNSPAFRSRKPFEKRMRAIGMTLMLGILLVISTVLVILGNQIFSWLFKFLKLSTFSAIMLIVLKWVIVLASIYMGIALIYRFGIPTRRRLHLFSPGALTATVLSILSSVVFSFYVDNFGNYNKIYGSFVAGIVLLLWLQLNAIILIIGFELNAAIAVNRVWEDIEKEKTIDEKEDREDFESVF
ncbi:MAG: YihY/virulence factor BrkB family protein [Saprospiraceae bacterium]|nr:YihY/virulence factor BrkB family protein [Saprospiraceae bacterium]